MLAASVALVLALACEVVPEIVPAEPEPAIKLVPMTFSATQVPDGVDDADTKATLEGLKIHWTAGDKIAVFDNVDPTTKHEFIASSTGESTSFSGSVSEGATKFFAVYPYSAADNCNMTDDPANESVGYMNVNIPSEQNAVPGGFDPAAAVLAAYTDSNEKALAFRIPFALAKFTVSYDDVKSVSFSSGKNMTGSLKVTMKESGSISTGDGEGTKIKSLTISNADGSALTKDATYYVVLRYRVGTNAYTNFTVNVTRDGGKSGTASASADVEMDKFNIKNLGNVSGMSFTTSRYAAYQQGEDVVIAGKTYNKTTDGDAVLLNTPSTNINDSQINAKVHFLAPGGSYTSSGLSFNTDVVIASDNPDERVVIKPSSTYKLNSGSLALDGILFNLTSLTSSSFFTNSNATADFDRLALSNCAWTNLPTSVTSLYAGNSAKIDCSIKEVLFSGCLVKTSGNLTAIIKPYSIASTPAYEFEKVEFSNNVIFSDTGDNVTLQLFVFNQKNPTVTTDYNMNLVIKNNLFYNAVTSGGSVCNYNIGSLEVTDNVLFAKDYSDIGAGSNAKIFALNSGNNSNYAANAIVSGNSAFGVLKSDGSGKWVICDLAYRTDGVPSTMPLYESSPVDASSDPSTGLFILSSICGSAGPNVMPQPIPAL